MADPVVDEIKARIDIADLVGQTVALKKAGRYLKGLCPFHHEKSPSFVVYPDQGTYHCFGCGKSGDAFTWLQETEHLDFGEALKLLAGRAGVQLPDRAPKPPDPETVAATDALQEAAVWYHEQLLKAPDAEAARAYLIRRGLKRETVERFHLGWAPDRWDTLCRSLEQKGITPEQIEAAGLARRGDRGLYDLFRGRVIFPIRNAEGKVCGFGGRTLGDGQPKYLNSPQTAFFDKSATLYGLDLARGAIRKESCAVIVEGYMDVVVPHQEGFQNVVASLGTALTEQQIGLLKRLTGTIVLALDADAAGQAATLRGLEVARQALAEQSRPVVMSDNRPARPNAATRTGYLSALAGQVKIAVLHGGKDPDEIVREDPQRWRELIASAVPMVQHKLESELARVQDRDPQTKVAAVQELARFLVQIPDPVEWGHYANEIAHRLMLDVRMVNGEMSRAARTLRIEQTRRERVAQRQKSSSDGAAPNSLGETTAGRLYQPQSNPEETLLVLADDALEEHLVSLLALAPEIAPRMPVRLSPEDFQRAECRELYREIERAPGQPLREPALRDYYETLLERARRRPKQTASQLEADLVGVVRRLKERNLHRQLREAQYLFDEAGDDDERSALKDQVRRLTTQLNRLHLEQSRATLYTTPLT